MTTIQQPKELTVEQYEFYKTKEIPMTDAQIIKIHGLDGNKLYAWKKKNDLIGKTYGKKEASNLKVYKKSDETPAPEPEKLPETKPLLLKESDIEKENQRKRILESIDEIDGYEANKKLKEKLESKKPEPDPLPAENELPKYASDGELEKEKSVEVSLVIEQLKVEMEAMRKEKSWLEERHVKDTAEKDALAEKLEKVERNSDYFAKILLVSEDVKAERYRQISQYGNQRHDYGTWLAILTEEFGEVAQAMQKERGWGKESDADDLYEELTHVAAVAQAFAEQVSEEREK